MNVPIKGSKQYRPGVTTVVIKTRPVSIKKLHAQGSFSLHDEHLMMLEKKSYQDVIPSNTVLKS